MRKYHFYCDPSHAWLKVQRKELVELGIEPKISGYSYQKDDDVFLEEDRDASIFADAWEAKHQTKLMNSQIIYHYRAGRIRTYQPFRPKHDQELNQKIRTVQEKIACAINQSEGTPADATKIDDLACELLKLEELSL